MFVEILDSSMEGCIPEYKSGSSKKNIYLTPEAIRKKNFKNELWRKYTRNKSSFDKRRYDTVKNELRSLTRKLRLEFEKSIARNIKCSPKSFWAYVKSKTKTNCKIPPLTKMDGSEATTSIGKAETLNNFFSSNFTEERLDDIPNDSESFLGEDLDSIIITEQMVQVKIQEMKPGKSPGPDGLHPVFLKNVADIISQPLSVLFQKSLIEGIVPSQWLKACITAIHKKGAKNLFENYRPISITSIVCKLMESIIRDNVLDHMVNNNLLSKNQHGFVPLRNCMTNLLLCMEDWTKFIEDGHPIDITDFAKAFDRVPHQRLLQKIKHLGRVGMTRKWIKVTR